MKQERQNKLSTQFAPETHEVFTKTGNIVVNESPEGVQLKRNTPHVKKYEELSWGQDTITPLPVETAPTEPEAVQGMAKSPILSRPARVRKLQEKFKNFVIT